jgi:hypothetical protein
MGRVWALLGGGIVSTAGLTGCTASARKSVLAAAGNGSLAARGCRSGWEGTIAIGIAFSLGAATAEADGRAAVFSMLVFEGAGNASPAGCELLVSLPALTNGLCTTLGITTCSGVVEGSLLELLTSGSAAEALELAAPLSHRVAEGSAGGLLARLPAFGLGGTSESCWLKYAAFPAASVISARRLIVRLSATGRKVVCPLTCDVLPVTGDDGSSTACHGPPVPPAS